MTPILLAIVPVAVTILTSIIKRLPVVSSVENQGTRNLMFRGVAAFLSLCGIVGAFMVSGTTPNPAVLQDIITTIALTFMAFLGAIGGHEVAKAK